MEPSGGWNGLELEFPKWEGSREQNSGNVEEVECGRNLKSGIKCELSGRCYHYISGSAKAQPGDRENWNCDKCK